MESTLTIPESQLFLPAGGSKQRNTPSLLSSFQSDLRELREIIDLRSLGITPAIAGGARGINDSGDVLTQTVDGRDLNDIWREYVQVLALHNARRQRLIDLLTFPVQQPIEDVPQLTGDDFEEATQYGIPKTIRGGDYFSLGYDFKWYDLRIAYTWLFLAEASAAQVDALHNMALEADNRLIFNKVLRAIFNNVNRQANIRNQAVPVYPFYNGDGTVPPDYKNNTFLGTHNHYLTSGAALVDSGDLDAMADHLIEHGYGKQAGATMILMVNRAQSATIRTFRVAAGDQYDFIPAQGQPALFLPANTGGITPAQPAAQFQGMDVIGAYGPWLIIEDDYVPIGYMVGFATGGEMNATNPVGFRQHANAGLRGLRLIPGNQQRYPLIDSYYSRGFGTGVRHRGAGVIMQVTAAGAYTIPADYV